MTSRRHRLTDEEWKRHVDTLFGCRACPTVHSTPISGPVRDARVLLVGQAPGPREEELGKPFAYTAGKRLFSWFAERGISEELFRSFVYIAAVIRCFPGRDEKAGGDRVPSREEIARCGVHLDREMLLLRPSLVIAVGTLAAGLLIGKTELKSIVGPLFRAERAKHQFDLVVLPHPSGRSTWLNKSENRLLLEGAMSNIVTHRAFHDVSKN